VYIPPSLYDLYGVIIRRYLNLVAILAWQCLAWESWACKCLSYLCNIAEVRMSWASEAYPRSAGNNTALRTALLTLQIFVAQSKLRREPGTFRPRLSVANITSRPTSRICNKLGNQRSETYSRNVDFWFEYPSSIHIICYFLLLFNFCIIYFRGQSTNG
jgi:hypothetical protein